MNAHERRAWNTLLHFGARKVNLGGKYALDVAPIRIRSPVKLAKFCHALIEVVGRSGANRRHVDRRGCPVYVVTDDKDDPACRVAPRSRPAGP